MFRVGNRLRRDLAAVAMADLVLLWSGGVHAAPPAATPPAATYGNWSVHCPGVSARNAFCDMAQKVSDQVGSGQPVLHISLSCNSGQRRCAIQIGLPPGLVPQEATLLALGAGVPLELPVLDCDRARCLAGAVLPMAFGERFARAVQVTVRFRDRRTGDHQVPLSLEGLAPAFADMVGRNMTIAANAATLSTREGNTR